MSASASMLFPPVTSRRLPCPWHRVAACTLIHTLNLALDDDLGELGGCGGRYAVKLEGLLESRLCDGSAARDDGVAAHTEALERDELGFVVEPLHKVVHLVQVEHRMAVDTHHLPIGHVSVPCGASRRETAGEDDRLLGLTPLDAGQCEVYEVLRRVRLPLLPPLVQVGLGQANECKAAIEKVRLGLIKYCGRHEPPQRLDRHTELEAFAGAQNGHINLLAGEAQVD
mmetsp:Transcript_43308/g.86646  ORF Transcript_43308/g.86646 Transcript_43308/m.86646 type:complete len:227 (-) Transcript_43308:54-734(-)